MTKQLIIGLATIAITGTALLSTGIFAANADITGTSDRVSMKRMNPLNEKDIISTLSGKVSVPALQELEALMTKHKTEMNTLMTGASVNETVIQAKHEAFKTEMEALITKYPELKTVIPQKGFGNKRGGENREMEKIIATLPTAIQTELQTIRESYKTKQEILRTEEKAKIDTLLSAYPDIKAKLVTARTEGGKHMKKFQKGYN